MLSINNTTNHTNLVVSSFKKTTTVQSQVQEKQVSKIEKYKKRKILNKLQSKVKI